MCNVLIKIKMIKTEDEDKDNRTVDE